MKEYSIHFMRFTVAFILVLTLQACGGSSNKGSENYTISANTSAITFSNEFLQVSEDTYQVEVNFDGNGLLLGFAPDSQAVGWLSYTTKNVTANSATVELKVINAENIVPDSYQTTLRLSTGDVNDVNLAHHDIDISLLVWQLTTDKETINFKTTLGEERLYLQTIDITSESDNSWVAGVDADWLTLDKEQGTGDDSITITADISAFNEAQLVRANLTLTETTTGDSKVIPIELGIDPHYLYSNQPTVGLSKTQNTNVTSKTVQIASNTANTYQLKATTSENWLNVVIPTENSDQVIISKSTEVSLPDGLHTATVIINAINDSGEINEEVGSETISIAYYQSSEETNNQVIADKNVAPNATAASPYLPYFYVAANNQIEIYQVYTGELTSSITVDDDGINLDQLLVHPEGKYMLVRGTETITADDGSDSQQVTRYKVDLINQTAEELTSADIEYEPVKFVSVNGRHFVISQTLELADDNLKRIFWDENNAFFTSQIDQAQNAQSIYALDVNDFSFKRYLAQVNDFTAEAISIEKTHDFTSSLLEEGQVISSFIADNNDKGLYLVSPNSEWISFDGATFTDQGLLDQNDNATTLSVVKANNGRAYFVRATQELGFYVDIYNEAQANINTISTNGQQPTALMPSADDARLIINAANAQQLELISIEQLKSSGQSLTFNTIVSADIPEAQLYSVSGLSDSWQVVTDVPWLSVNTLAYIEGMLTLDISMVDGQLTTPGAYQTQVVVRDLISGASATINVIVNIDAVRITSNYPALAFNDMTNIDTLSHTVNILNNLNDPNLDWTASTSANWLTLDADQTQDTLHITADPSALTDGMHTANITLSPNVNHDAQGDEITVTVHKSSDPSEELVINDININNDNNQLNAVLDPVRPYLYIATGHHINAINIYNGDIINTVSTPLADINLTNLVIHPDGSLLLASNLETYQNEAGEEQTRVNHYKIDLASFTLSQIPADKITINSNFRPKEIVLMSGQAVVVTQSQEFADLNLTSLFWQSENAFVSNQFYDIKNNSSVLSFNSLDNTVYQYEFNYNKFAENPLTLANKISYQNSSFNNSIRNLAASNSGDVMYSASPLSEWAQFDGEAFTDQGVLFGTPVVSSIRVVTDSSDNVYFYRFDTTSGFTLAKFNSVQQQLWQVVHTTGSLDTLIAPDYQRLISYSSANNTLSFDTLPD